MCHHARLTFCTHMLPWVAPCHRVRVPQCSLSSCVHARACATMRRCVSPCCSTLRCHVPRRVTRCRHRHVPPCHRIPLGLIMCLSSCANITMFHHVSPLATVCHLVPQCTTLRHYVTLCTDVCHCAAKCQHLSVLVNIIIITNHHHHDRHREHQHRHLCSHFGSGNDERVTKPAQKVGRRKREILGTNLANTSTARGLKKEGKVRLAAGPFSGRPT